ncbi:MAG: hypothetical protein J7513_07190 [Solirubrobacteraceae bacterium]|nr:hypothetical protein [Solirubrobacteraceae bacterium]
MLRPSLARLALLGALALSAVPGVSDAAVPADAPGAPASSTYGLDGTRAQAADDGVGEWQLADGIADRLLIDWRPKLGAYDGQTGIAIRTNAMMLELFAHAAREGYTGGAARNDENARRLVELLTQPPVLVWRTKLKRSSAVFPHTPAFAGAYFEDPARAPLHPSADAIVARALADAWDARDALGLDAAHRALIQRAVRAVAGGSFYRKGRRAENQINWNADVLMADWQVNRRKASLMAYRHQLIWFARSMTKAPVKYGTTSTTPGGAFHYWLPAPGDANVNRTGTGEYANLVRTALGWYGVARAGGMPRIPGWAIGRLSRWSRQVVIGTWTEAGYLNWDSGLAARRKHLRQYWGFALDGLIRGSRSGAIGGDATTRGIARATAARGVELFARTAWNGTGALPGPTSFGAINGFPSATNNDATAPLRFAIAELERRDLLSDVSPLRPRLLASHDSVAGRLAITTAAYNTAILRSGTTEEGGLEPTRLFDGRQRPLTVLMADAFVGPAPGLRLLKGATRVLADTQPGRNHGLPLTSGMGVAPQRVNRSSRYPSYAASGRTAETGPRITVSHRFTADRITTSYRLRPAGKATRFVLRFPFWGADSVVTPLAGATASGGQWKRTSGPLRIDVTTTAGAHMVVTFTGVPTRADVRLTTTKVTGRAPAGTRYLSIVGSVRGVSRLTRELSIGEGSTAG